MRTKTITIYERELMFVIAGQLFDQAPNRQPRKAEVIMQKVRDAYRKEAHNDNEFYSLNVAEGGTYEYIKSLLMGIPEFVELNLSQVEFDKNISVDDESRPKYAFSSRYDRHDADSWKHDFIDLDAFIGNVHGRLFAIKEMEQDCFCCRYQGTKSEICKTCSVNPALKYSFAGTRKPKGNYTFSCKYNCLEQKMICCEECDKRDACWFKCDSDSKVCGNVVLE